MKINDMMAPPPLHLPADPAAGLDPAAAETAFAHPDSPLVWVTRAEMLLAAGSLDDVAKLTAYAHARTAYHRSLDRLRANGWKGWGPVPFEHEANQPVLRAIAALARAARLIGEDNEYDRCRQMLSDADPASVARLIDEVA
ncbi:DUF3151 domain-containing protein [Corynebacterium sp.]|uniref:DUF3151 domain-containing protein n=1 Tax=Corynebacterium sp. TaxID=1720 RepID=UPI0019B502FB|nr:DUF3151 domain-containing protein [Corynebacterium sp.]HHU66401.1 DUF3151 domain-containing protein [Corynebacterium sp.]